MNSIHEYLTVNRQEVWTVLSPCAGRWAGERLVTSTRPSTPGQGKSCKASGGRGQQTASHCPSCHCSPTHLQTLNLFFFIFNGNLKKTVTSWLTRRRVSEGSHWRRPRPSLGSRRLQYSAVPGTWRSGCGWTGHSWWRCWSDGSVHCCCSPAPRWTGNPEVTARSGNWSE